MHAILFFSFIATPAICAIASVFMPAALIVATELRSADYSPFRFHHSLLFAEFFFRRFFSRFRRHDFSAARLMPHIDRRRYSRRPVCRPPAIISFRRLR